MCVGSDGNCIVDSAMSFTVGCNDHGSKAACSVFKGRCIILCVSSIITDHPALTSGCRIGHSPPRQPMQSQPNRAPPFLPPCALFPSFASTDAGGRTHQVVPLGKACTCASLASALANLMTPKFSAQPPDEPFCHFRLYLRSMPRP